MWQSGREWVPVLEEVHLFKKKKKLDKNLTHYRAVLHEGKNQSTWQTTLLSVTTAMTLIHQLQTS